MFTTIARSLFAGVIGYLASGIEVQAQDTSPRWTVDKSSGEVWVVTSGAQNIALTSGTGLKDGDNVRTGKTGRVMLRRGQETILIAPNSVVGLPAETKPGATTIIQQAGSIVLEVNKRDARTFEVETPYLVAAVKGTQFRVTVGAQGAGVNVQHGSVEVADLKSGKFALVFPGQNANVTSVGGLSLQGIGTLSPIQNGAPRASTIGRVPVPRAGLVAPASIRAALQAPAKAASAVRSSAGGGLRIASPIGQVRLDVNTATRGLARDAGTPTGRSAATIWNNGNNGGNAGVPAGTVAASGAALSSAIGASVNPAVNNSRAQAGPTPVTAAGNGNGTAASNAGGQGNGNGIGYAYGNNGGNGKGNNGNGNGNGGGNGSSAGGNGNGNNGSGIGNGGGNGSSAAGYGNGSNAGGNGGGNGKGNNGNGNGNGGGNGSNAGGNGNGNNGNGNGNGGGNGSNAGGNGNGNGNSGRGR